MKMIDKPITTTVYDFHMGGKTYHGTVKDISGITGLTEAALRRYVNMPTRTKEMVVVGKEYPIYELIEWRNDKVIAKGTKDEIAATVHMKVESLHNSTKYELVYTGKHKVILDDEAVGMAKMIEPPVLKAKKLYMSSMDAYWRMVFRDSFRGWKA